MAGATPSRTLRVHVDVTDTVATHWRAGIQRVVAQLVAQLDEDPRLEVVPVVWLESVRGFRRLTADEAARLGPDAAPAADPAEPVAAAAPGGDRSLRTRAVVGARTVWTRARPALAALRRAVRGALVAVRVEPELRRVRRWWHRKGRDRHLVPLVLDLRPGSVLFELDTVWNNTWVERAELYRGLRGDGVHLAALVYDLLPQQHPEWFEPSLVRVSDRTIAAQAAHAELLVAISRHTATSLVDWAHHQGLRPVPPEVIALGADATPATRPSVAEGAPAAGEAATPLPPELAGVRYVLAVGTVEPRKNHTTLLDAFERVWHAEPDAHLVVVGRPGWHNEAVIDRLRRHPEAGRRLHWFRAAGDDLLATLYRHARAVAVTSITEGYGLPVIEAMAHGVPVLSSDGGALVEAGGDMVEHLGATDVGAWVDALVRQLTDDDLDRRRRDQLAGYQVPTWAETGRQVADLLVQRFGDAAG
jgi:glycosyltransferase involved in cell wall biosynthesis